MELPLSLQARRAVELLDIASLLHAYRHRHRARLIACLRRSYPELFTNENSDAVKLARAAIIVGARPDDFKTIVRDFNEPIVELLVLLYMLDEAVKECTEHREEWRRMQLETRVAIFEPEVPDEAKRFFGMLPGFNAYITEHPKKIYDGIVHACQIALDSSVEHDERKDRSSRRLYHAANTAWLNNIKHEETVATFGHIQARFSHAGEEASIACYLATIYLLNRFPIPYSQPPLKKEQERLLHRAMLELAKFL